MKTTRCPWCQQEVQDFSNNPIFVRNLLEKEESKDSKEKLADHGLRKVSCTKCGEQIPWHWHWCDYCGEYQ